MHRNCTKCTDIDQELITSSASIFRHAVEPLKSLIKVEVGSLYTTKLYGAEWMEKRFGRSYRPSE